ncbi:MAG TPA: hypothetical protein PKX93_11050 [bacterium]|nr:hypothetical protein [bacterium]HOL67980.1 hypothetical protein [bacterium]HPP13267.1 hypothetical protein [bacterium]
MLVRAAGKTLCFLVLATGWSVKAGEGEPVTFVQTVDLGKYQVVIEPSGRIKEIKKGNTLLLERLGLFAYPMGSGRLFQGGSSPECFEKVTAATRMFRENGKITVKREAIIGNEKFPEAVKYRYEASFSPDGKVSIAYEVEYLVTTRWRAYAGEFIYRIPLVSIAGKEWIAEMKNGAVNAGTNPSTFTEDNRKEWVSIDNGSRLSLESTAGRIELVPRGQSYLRGGIEGSGTAIYVISLPREAEIPAGTKQSLQLDIFLPVK